MMKKIKVILFFILIRNLLIAQSGDLVVQGISPDLHLLHTVAPKENWYSIGRLYNISPKEIAPYNGVTLDKPLSIGERIKLPLTTTNFSQDGNKVEDEVFIPLYHMVQDKEWMYRISTNYNKVPVENIEKWNNLSKDDVKEGMKLIVGYLKVKKDQSALATNGLSAVKSGTAPVNTKNESKTETVIKQDKTETLAQPLEEKKILMNLLLNRQ